MLSSIRSLAYLLVSISSVSSLAVPPAQSDPQNRNLASLVLTEHVNLTSIPSSLGSPPKELGAFAWQCSEKAYGHKLETHNVAEAFRKIPNNPAPMVFSKTPAPGEGAVKVPARFLGGGRAEFTVTTTDARPDVVSWMDIRRAAGLLVQNCNAGQGFHWGGAVEDVGAAGLILVILHDPLSPGHDPNEATA